jgi:hypothetical protein
MTFGEHVALLREFLNRRQEIVEEIERRLLNVQGKETSRARSRGELEQILESCFFGLPGLDRELSRLKGQLAASHLADGFEPIAFEGSSHDFDPVELILRAQRHWERRRWPGRNVRLPYAGRLYSVFILRQLEHLSLRVWDEGSDAAADRLQETQLLLDGLNGASMADGLVRDARWLIQTAQGTLTRRLEPYFRTAERISASFTTPHRLEIHKAGAMLASAHLRSQLHHRAAESGRPVDDAGVLAVTRNANSMDAALLVRDLVPLLEAYGTACIGNNLERRLELADAILQGVSADPALFLTRLDLLAPYTMVEDLFISCGEDGVRYTPMGETHRHLLESYAALIARHAVSLQEDAPGLDPRHRVYSPLGIVSGFCADMLSNIALDMLLSQPSVSLSLEDMFDSRGRLESKRARADGWKARQESEGASNPVDYSAGWAAQMFDRTTAALRARAQHKDRANASEVPSARLFVETAPEGTLLAQEHCLTSDLQRALSTGATAFPKGQLLIDRNEGRFLASAEVDGKWFGISKVVLTLCTSQGRDALVTGVPTSVVDTLRLTCPGLVVLTGSSSEGCSVPGTRV